MQEELLEKISSLEKSPVGDLVRLRHSEFRAFSKKPEEDWFSELCFCLLTANTSAEMGLRVQNALGFGGFYKTPQESLAKKLKSAGSRFYNRRAEFIFEAREHFGLKEKISSFPDGHSARAYLAKNVKGMGFKEASHFLRNTGSDNVAILDKHVLNLLAEQKIIPEVPRAMNEKNYLAIESHLDSLAKKASLCHAELDLYLWFMKTGKVLK